MSVSEARKACFSFLELVQKGKATRNTKKIIAPLKKVLKFGILCKY
jgi:hypothetical protein